MTENSAEKPRRRRKRAESLFNREERDAIRHAVAEALRPVMDRFGVIVYVDIVRDEEANPDRRTIVFKC